MANRIVAKKKIDSELIKTKMKELGLTNKDLAEKLKINEKTLRRWLESEAIPIDKMPDLDRELFVSEDNMAKRNEMTTDNAIAVLRRMQEPDPFEPQITQTAFDALEMAIDMIERYSTWSQTYSNMVEDAISRQAAIRWVKTECNSYGKPTLDYESGKKVIEHLEAMPSAQEIIRCKDCKHQVKEWRDDKRLKDKGYWVYGCKVISDICGYWAGFGHDDEFCSEAERRK